ncbi:MAG TPA: SH3 domain-containing protein [Aggregatilinea sp.]|uniref:SH3 domain-containing protein n=1 Tax=Aggregatilinea sp. TaxID=2806333 RepID=UPI002C89FF3F|nr:SH3 domain-containing protein [Aggregatilinea sp.]HML21694.1 SH3 domain-containing protein [Aggregatilinea sp.]
MRGFKFFSLFLVIVLALAVVPVLHAQGDVSVVTIYDAVLRGGPGTSFEQVGGVPVSTTIPAVGRNGNSSWIQVNYDGTVGWVSATLLEWSGDIGVLPVTSGQPASDTPDAAPAAASGGVTATNGGGINVRSGPSTSDAVLGQLPAGSTVALNARWGSGRSMWVRFDYNGRVGWLASWVVTISGDANTLPDVSGAPQTTAPQADAPQASVPLTADRAALLDQLQAALDNARAEWQPIADKWHTLAAYIEVTCAVSPLQTTPVTINAVAYPDIQDAVNVLNWGINETQRAMDEWIAECLLDRYWVPDEVSDSGWTAIANSEGAFTDVQNRINAMRGQ